MTEARGCFFAVQSPIGRPSVLAIHRPRPSRSLEALSGLLGRATRFSAQGRKRSAHRFHRKVEEDPEDQPHRPHGHDGSITFPLDVLPSPPEGVDAAEQAEQPKPDSLFREQPDQRDDESRQLDETNNHGQSQNGKLHAHLLATQ